MVHRFILMRAHRLQLESAMHHELYPIQFNIFHTVFSKGRKAHILILRHHQQSRHISPQLVADHASELKACDQFD